MKRLLLLGFVGALASASPAFSLFDFESFAATSSMTFGVPGTLTSLTDTDNGLTLTITRSSQSAFDIWDNTSSAPYGLFFPLQWGDRCLDPFSNYSTNDYFVGNFDKAVNAVELEMTDFGADDDVIEMNVWSGLNGTGTLLATQTQSWPSTQSSPNWGAVGWASNSLSARSITFRGGATYPQSMFVDNIAARAVVPEPATLGAIGIGLAGLFLRRRR